MRNVTSIALCWTMTLALVAVALGQQQSDTQWRNAPEGPPPTKIDTNGMPIERALPGQDSTSLHTVIALISGATGPENSPNQFGAQRPLPPPDPTGIRSMIEQSTPAGHLTISNTPPRGELGIWMGETGGPGVRILRVSSGSAAQEAGLRPGDFILKVNGQGVSSARAAATLIKKSSAGESNSLTIWRDGNEQEVTVTLKPAQQNGRTLANEPPHDVAFGGSDSGDSDLSSRTQRLEQQINSLTQELASLRQELAQLKTAGPVQTGYNTPPSQNTPPQPPQDRYNFTPSKVAPVPLNATLNVGGGFVPTEEKPAKPATDAAKPTPPPAQPATPPKPPAPAEKSSSNDLFSPDSSTPPNQDKPKTEDKPKSDDKPSDDLFK